METFHGYSMLLVNTRFNFCHFASVAGKKEIYISSSLRSSLYTKIALLYQEIKITCGTYKKLFFLPYKRIPLKLLEYFLLIT